jgi:16S rRNA (cytosine1402-N4)-methyltransferase
MHTPVLLQETIEALNIKPQGKYIDATYGLGGHSLEMVRKGGDVLALDWDDDNVKNQKSKVKNTSKKLKLVNSNFAQIEEVAVKNGFEKVDGVLFDLGISMEQIGGSGRGFSYKKLDEPLDMRISQELERTGADIINYYSKEKLYEVFAKGSEELASLGLAGLVVRARAVKKIEKVDDLVAVIKKLRLSEPQTEAVMRRIFQALRIEVNEEFENLKKGLDGAKNILDKDGRIVVITFHPGEDRIVKRFVRENNLKLITKKAAFSENEKAFERSAKLRIITS